MYATPLTRSTLGKTQSNGTPRALVARASSRRGWGWHFLALHHKPHGWVERDLGSFLHDLYRELFVKGNVHFLDAGDHTLVLLVFPGGDAVVARCDRPMAAIVPLLDAANSPLKFERGHPTAPGALVFAPVLLTLVKDVPLERVTVRGCLVPTLDMNGATRLRVEQDMRDVVAEMDALGPVLRPWDAQPGDLVAPWAIGRANPEPLALVVQGALLDLAPNLPTSTTVEVMGMTLSDKGTIQGAPEARVDSWGKITDQAEWDRFQAWVARLHTRTIPGVPLAHLVGQTAAGFNRMGRDSQRVATPIARTSRTLRNAHHRLQALAAYRAVS